MGNRNRRKTGARRYADYSEETLAVAVDLVKSKALSSYEAEKQFGIPRRTILNKCKSIHNKAVGRPQELSAEEEQHIAEVVEVAADFGSPLTLVDLRIVVYNYLSKCGKTDMFKGRMPGDRWARNFLTRHDFTQRATQNIKRSRASKTVEEMTAFFENMELSLKDVPPASILNFDETNLSDDPGSNKAIFKRGTKHPERVLNATKSSVSIMFSGTADGEILPPYVVYKADNLWSRWCEFGPPNARYNRTKSGWFDMVCFDNWFETIVLPWAKSREGPKVVIGDNLSSHLSVEVVKLCQENNIKLIFLPSNATHLTQPLDVAFFGPMKRCWRDILLRYKLSKLQNSTINKCDFPQLLHELMTKIKMGQSENLRSGFAAAGIFPFNPSRVLKKIPVVSSETSKHFDVCLLQYLKNMRSSTTQSKKSANKKLSVIAGKSISTEEADQLKKSSGRSTNKNSDLNTTSSNVRYLSQATNTEENLPFISTENMPTCLQTSKSIGSRIKPVRDLGIKVLSEEIIRPGQSFKKMSNLPLQKTGLQKYKIKNTLVYSGSTTSVSDDMSKHSDSSIIDIPENDTDSDDIPLYCLKRSRLLCSSNNDNEPALNYKDDQISVDMLCDSNCNQDIVSSTVSRRESMSSTNSKISSFPPICESIIPGTSYAQARCSPTEDLIFNGDIMLSDKIPSPSSENEQTSMNYSVNDTVLVRYYTKNKWKYYIGVISACNHDDSFDISFYVTTRSKGQLKFKRPKKIDRDTVPKISIEKIITIDKISDKPEEYKLQNQADALYF